VSESSAVPLSLPSTLASWIVQKNIQQTACTSGFARTAMEDVPEAHTLAVANA
jgi:hypothetical protein